MNALAILAVGLTAVMVLAFVSWAACRFAGLGCNPKPYRDTYRRGCCK